MLSKFFKRSKSNDNGRNKLLNSSNDNECIIIPWELSFFVQYILTSTDWCMIVSSQKLLCWESNPGL